jgi:Ca2+-binding RTX toxin-like protein
LIIGDTFDLNTEAVSGTRFNDTILGDSRTDLQPTLAGVAINPLDNRLTEDKFAQIGGLFSTNVALDGALINNTLLNRADLFTGAPGARALSFGNILLGGGGADSIQGNGGNDIIDGDLELTVQIEWRPANGPAQRFDSMTQVQEATTILVAAAAQHWAPISHEGVLHDRASYRYYWQLLERAHRTAMPLPQEARQWFVTEAA